MNFFLAVRSLTGPLLKHILRKIYFNYSKIKHFQLSKDLTTFLNFCEKEATFFWHEILQVLFLCMLYHLLGVHMCNGLGVCRNSLSLQSPTDSDLSVPLFAISLEHWKEGWWFWCLSTEHPVVFILYTFDRCKSLCLSSFTVKRNFSNEGWEMN